MCIPSYVASQIWKIDDERKAAIFRNEFEILFARINNSDYRGNRTFTPRRRLVNGKNNKQSSLESILVLITFSRSTYFNQTTWTGLNDNRNIATIDPQSFNDCNNVYLDANNVLCSSSF